MSMNNPMVNQPMVGQQLQLWNSILISSTCSSISYVFLDAMINRKSRGTGFFCWKTCDILKKIDRNELRRRMQSYFGWLKFCNSKNLLHKIQLETGLRFSNWNGKKVNISRFYGKYIHIVDIILYSNRFRVNFVYNYKSYYFESKNKRLLYSVRRYSLPVNFKITPYVRPKKNRSKSATRTD